MPGDLEAIVEKALRTKIPKLVATTADKRILLLERDQIAFGDSEIYRQIAKLGVALADRLQARYMKAKTQVDRLTQSVLAKAPMFHSGVPLSK